MTTLAIVTDDDDSVEGVIPHAPDYVAEALEQVSRESGVPVSEFCYVTDQNAGPMGVLNRRAYVLAATNAGVRIMEAFHVPDVTSLRFYAARRSISGSAVIALREVYDAIARLGVGTASDAAKVMGVNSKSIKSRITRLSNAGLLRQVSTREDECGAHVWTVTDVPFGEIFTTAQAVTCEAPARAEAA